MTPAEAATHLRPRVEGDREREILDAALEVLSEVGYDRLTMDAVAQRAKASKATLYRRWNSKATLVVDALATQKASPPVPDSGDLRTDLLTAFCGMGGLTDHDTTLDLRRGDDGADAPTRSSPTSSAPACCCPRRSSRGPLFQRAVDRGEVRADLDLDLVAPALAGIVLHRLFVMGEEPGPTLIEHVIDQIILPAVRPQA